MSESIILPEALQQSARDMLYRLGNLGEVYIGPNFHNRRIVQDGEHLQYEYPTHDTVIFFRSGQGTDYSEQGDSPRLVLSNIRVAKYDNLVKGTPEPVGSPVKETRISASVDLNTNETATLAITDAFSSTVTELESTMIAIQNAAKVRFGATTTPVGLELSSQITNQLTSTRTDSTTATSTTGLTQVVKNEEKHLVRVHLEAVRTIQRVRYTSMIDAPLDYEIRWVPWQPGFKIRLEGLKSATWGSVEEFYSSMEGREPSNVGNISGWYSLSDRARGAPQSRPPRRVIHMPFTEEHDEQINFTVRQVREPI